MLKQSWKRRGRFGRCEQLESRSMLSGTPLIAPPPPVHACSPPPPAQVSCPGGPSGSSSTGSTSASATTLTAQLIGATASVVGTANYTTCTVGGTTVTTLCINVSGAAANSPLTIMIAGTALTASLTTNASGNGTLVLSSNPTGSQVALPSGLAITAATTISVGSLSGTFAAATTQTPPPPPPPAPCPPPSGTAGQAPNVSLTATLTSASSGTAVVGFTSTTTSGVTTTTFSVTVTGAAAGTTLNVMIGNCLIGTITTDGTGAGTLVLSSSPTGTESALPTNFPKCILPGTIVSVGSLTGPLTATATGTTASSTVKIA